MLLPTFASSAKSTTTKVSSAVFAAKVNPTLLAQAVRVYLSNQRQGTKHAKTRGEVHGTGKKIYRQKGTGRARHGDRLAPIFVKGGVAHGPKGNENYTKVLPRSLRRLALASALTAKAQTKQVMVIQDLEKHTKTNSLANLLKAVLAHKGTPKPTIIVVDTDQNPLIRTAKNLPYTTVTPASRLTTYQIIRHHHVVLTPQSIPVIEKRISSI